MQNSFYRSNGLSIKKNLFLLTFVLYKKNFIYTKFKETVLKFVFFSKKKKYNNNKMNKFIKLMPKSIKINSNFQHRVSGRLD